MMINGSFMPRGRMRAILYGFISLVSLAGNAAYLAEALEAKEIELIFQRLISAGEILLRYQRPAIFLILNIILVKIVLKSGLLGSVEPSANHDAAKGGRNPTRGVHVEEAEWLLESQPVVGDVSSVPEGSVNEKVVICVPSTLRQVAGCQLEPAPEIDPSGPENIPAPEINDPSGPTMDEAYTAIMKLKNKVSSIPANAPAPEITSTPETSPVPDISSIPEITDPSNPTMDEVYMTIMKLKSAAEDDCNVDEIRVSDSQGLISAIASLRSNNSTADFNAECDSFIAKFKRNLTEQRQNSVNQLIFGNR